MTQLALWRLDRATVDSATRPDRLADGLRLHVQHAPLLAVLVCAGAHRRAFVATSGCAACAQKRCDPGCRGELLRRLVAALIPAGRLVASGGLAARPYRRAAIAWPTGQAQPIPASALAGWEEARLTLHWSGARGAVSAAAALAAGADGPDPSAVLASLGWSAWALPSPLVAAVAAPPIPRRLPAHRPWHGAPALLLPDSPTTAGDQQPAENTSPEELPDAFTRVWEDGTRSVHLVPELARRALASLAALEREMAGTATAEPDRAADPAREQLSAIAIPLEHIPACADLDASYIVPEGRDGRSWPAGPGALGPQALEALVRRIVADPAFTEGRQRSQVGLTRRRLEQLPGVSADIAGALMVWFGDAGVIAGPYSPARPWATPRPLVECEPAAIAARLSATPLPTAEQVAAAFPDC